MKITFFSNPVQYAASNAGGGIHAEAIANGNGFNGNQGVNDAFFHTYASGTLTYEYGDGLAELIGDIKESYSKNFGTYTPQEEYMDQFNNELGRRIADWMKQNNIPWNKFDDLMMDAYNHGRMIVNSASSQIPSDVGQENGTDPGSASNDVTWTGPSSNWQGASAGRQYYPEDADRSWWQDFKEFFSNPLTSPLVLDLDGDGIELRSLANSTAMFDLDANGFIEHTGWVGPDDGLLAIDSNANGRIDNINELFGNSSTDGFIVLDALDSNNDNKISSTDTQFANLRIWKDANGNGITDSGELQTLAAMGIASINLNYTAVNQTNQGHHISSTSTYTRTDSTTRSIVDAWFQHEKAESLYVLPANHEFDSSFSALPELRGYGEVPSLWIAMDQDATLEQMVEDVVTGSFSNFSFKNFAEDVEAVALRWFGVDGVSPTSRGSYVDARHLAAVEKMLVQDFYAFGSASPNVRSGEALEWMWKGFVFDIAAKILVQIPKLESEGLLQAGFEAIIDDPDFNTMTQQDMEAVMEDYYDDAVAALDGHPLKHLAFADYSGFSNMVNGNFGAIVSALSDNDPVAAPALQNYWFDWLPFINAVANSQDLSDTAYNAALAGSYLDGIIPGDMSFLRGDGLILGTSANETLTGSMGLSTEENNFLIGGLGNDRLEGDYGNDTFIYSLGDGNDVIQDHGLTGDKLLLNGIEFGDVLLVRNGSTLNININGGGSVSILDQLSVTNNEIEAIHFQDTIMSASQVRLTLLNQASTSGNDLITGFGGDDTITGGLGNDTLHGEYGSDIYTYNKGDGNDTIFDFGLNNDLIQFGTGIAPSGLLYDRVGDDDLLIQLRSGRIIVENQFNASNDRIETLKFADTSTITWQTIDSYFSSDTLGTASSNTLSGSSNADRIWGLEGNDSLSGNNGNDLLGGGYGNDTLDGGTGNDTLWGSLGNDSLIGGDGHDSFEGGAGNDTLRGGNGNDSFKYQYGDGQDQLFDLIGDDRVDLTGIADLRNITGYTSVLVNGTTSTAITFADGGYVYFYGLPQINQTTYTGASSNYNGVRINDNNNSTVRFDGRTDIQIVAESDDSRLIGGANRQYLAGNAGDDVMTGGAGGDVFYYGVENGAIGHDIVTDFAVGSDKIDIRYYNTSWSALQPAISSNASGHAVLTFYSGNDVTLQGVSASSLSASDFIFQ